MFTIYHSDFIGNPGNCSYPHKADVTTADTLTAAVCRDYVCAEYRNNYRSSDNFIGSDCYVFAQNRYKDKTIVLEKQLEQLKQADCRLSEDGVEANPWLTAMLCFRDEPVLTRGMAEALIDHVVVYDKSTIHVTLRYEDELKCLWEGLSPALGVAVND